MLKEKRKQSDNETEFQKKIATDAPMRTIQSKTFTRPELVPWYPCSIMHSKITLGWHKEALFFAKNVNQSNFQNYFEFRKDCFKNDVGY